MKRKRCPILNWAASIALLAFVASSSVPLVRADVMSVSIVSPGTYGEANDYFTTVWGNPRDMNDPADLYVLNSSCNPAASAMWADTGYANGIWHGTTSAGTWRYLFVLNPGWASTLDIGEDGQLHKVNTSVYTQVSFRMRVASGAGNSAENMLWTDGPIGTTQRGTKSFQVQSDGQWHIYTMDLSSDTSWTSGPVSSLWLQLNGLTSGYRVEVDWVRLTPKQNRQITWSGGNGSVRIYLGSSLDDPEQRSLLSIYDPGKANPRDVQASSGSLSIPSSLPGGTYYARVADSGGSADSGNAWVFKSTPIAIVEAPSYTSGEDYATAVLGNPWDMSALDDVDTSPPAKTEGIKSLSVSDGILTIVSNDDGRGNCADPWPHRPLAFNLGGHSIDTRKFKYFSYRYKVDNAPDQGAGGVTRVRWQAQSILYWPTGRTDDISLYDNGWHVYSLDLSKARLEVEGGRWGDFPVDVMQIIVHESHREWTSHLDWAKLTAENTAASSYTVRWSLVNNSSVLTTTIYWATEPDASAVIAPGYIVPGPEDSITGTLPYTVLLPSVLRVFDGSSGTQHSYMVGTEGLVTGGYYYIVIKLQDGYNTAWWYSQVPVRKL